MSTKPETLRDLQNQKDALVGRLFTGNMTDAELNELNRVNAAIRALKSGDHHAR